MRYWLILVLSAALPWGLVAQTSQQQQLPNAPSSYEVSAAGAGSATACTVRQHQQPTRLAPAAEQLRLLHADGPTRIQSTDSGSARRLRTAARRTGRHVTIIRKRVDEVNVVFTVTDKRDHFVKDLTQNDFRVSTTASPH